MRRGVARCCPKSSSPKTCGLRRSVLSTRVPPPALGPRTRPVCGQPQLRLVDRDWAWPHCRPHVTRKCGRPDFGWILKQALAPVKRGTREGGKKFRQDGAQAEAMTEAELGGGRYVPREWPVQRKGKRRRRQSCTLPAWTSSASSATRCSSTPSPSPTLSCGASVCALHTGSEHTHSWARQSLRERGRPCRRRMSASSWRTA